MKLAVAVEDRSRFEVLPLGRSEAEAAQLPVPVRLTVTCSPTHGPDRSVEVGARLRALGHSVTVHVAARMVRDRAHLDALMAAMAAAGIDDVFVIGGDAAPSGGAYASAIELVAAIAEHPQRPHTIGIAGYPEGHPMIEPETLEAALREKARHADYVTTQMCFDPDVLRAWILEQRERGMKLPVFIGLPGKVAARRLLEMSVRIGVGPSLAFVRKQHGIRALIFRRSASDRLYRSLAPALDDPRLNVAGLHYYTFNQLIDTWQWQHEKPHGSASHGRPGALPAPSLVHPEQGTTRERP